MSFPSEQDGSSTNDAFDDVDAFEKLFTAQDADKPSDTAEDDDEQKKRVQPDDDEAEDNSAQDEPDEANAEDGDDGNDKPKKYADDDDIYVKVKVGDTEHEVPVKDLKRLWGQENALNTKAQQAAEARKVAEAEYQKYLTGTAAMLDRAKKRFEPYAKIDFLLASRELSPEEYTALRNEATAAYEDVQFLQGEVEGLVQEIQQKSQQDFISKAKEAIKVLSGDPKDGGIEGWNEKLYDDIRSYGVTQGIPETDMNRLIDPHAIRIIHKAMMFDRGKKAAVTKVNKTATKVIKTSSNPEEARKNSKGAPVARAHARLKSEGSVDAAADAFLANWAN